MTKVFGNTAVEDRGEQSSNYASPPCYQHEVAHAGEDHRNRDEVVRLLNTLLEGERAGAVGLRELSHDVEDSFLKPLLSGFARDETQFCAMLTRHLIRFDVAPSQIVGPFYEKLKALKSLPEKIELLKRGQNSVVRTLDNSIPRIEDNDLRADLAHMRDVHILNTVVCADLKLARRRDPREVIDS